MAEKEKFVLEERPESDVYLTDSGFIGIKQVLHGEENIVLFTPDEAEQIIGFVRKMIDKQRAKTAR